MSTNPIEDNSTPKPTGSLEDLFRHHLGEEAAVPPRPMLWDQIDNSLLIRQNETYRRRLLATRWVAAASLLLATLAGTGWWANRTADMAGTEVATATRTTGTNSGNNTSTTSGAAASGSGQAGNNAATESVAATSPATSSANFSASGSLTNNGKATSAAARDAYAASQAAVAANSAGRTTGFGPSSARPGLENGSSAAGRTASSTSAIERSASNSAIAVETPSVIPGALYNSASRTTEPAVAVRTTQADATDNTALGSPDKNNTPAFPLSEATVAASTTGSALTGGSLTSGAVGQSGTSSALAAISQASSVAVPEPVSLLAARPAALSLTNPATLPDGLAALAMPAEAESAVASAASKWRFGGAYTAGAFNPNINFSRAGIEAEHGYNPALGANSPALTEAAAAQYRENLRPGLSQRLALVAKRHLTGNWSLSTGLSLTQATAKSASTSAFVGEQLIDLGPFTNGKSRTTDFRYHMAGIPVEVTYNNPLKRGWSLYGRLGGAVSALLGVRSEVEGAPEATKTYSIMSAAGPYRRALASVRGGAGAQFRPGTGQWAFTLGPVAEMNVVTLNAHPAQSYLRQNRAYSFGLEAGVEFGR
ncbi:hypothetical protein I2I05_13790 [Hymenobacter sp. BT683]|uniref:Outer membrane protein beta-barrel domain-containing protein n=1 Tax=Hymenobacter jeongseonensis TaxID=2791027 RepID=A0ABS0IJB4_9BACT|nr:hypothetical protein [Hymenobacter jeongseonensis]MBF9238473.1 hypothetical protein [Hymenobacter jeongseonensis]